MSLTRNEFLSILVNVIFNGQESFDLFGTNSHGETILHVCCKNGAAELILCLLQHDNWPDMPGDFLSTLDNSGKSALYVYATRAETDLRVMKAFISRYTKYLVSMPKQLLENIFIERGQLECLEVLHQNAEIVWSDRDYRNRTPWECAVETGNVDIVQWVYARTGNVSAHDQFFTKQYTTEAARLFFTHKVFKISNQQQLGFVSPSRVKICWLEIDSLESKDDLWKTYQIWTNVLIEDCVIRARLMVSGDVDFVTNYINNHLASKNSDSFVCIFVRKYAPFQELGHFVERLPFNFKLFLCGPKDLPQFNFHIQTKDFGQALPCNGTFFKITLDEKLQMATELESALEQCSQNSNLAELEASKLVFEELYGSTDTPEQIKLLLGVGDFYHNKRCFNTSLAAYKSALHRAQKIYAEDSPVILNIKDLIFKKQNKDL